MSNRNEQNGRQPQTQPPPKCDSECTNENVTTTEQREICKDFVWGKCNKSSKCRFRHELDFEAMKKILKFCHDHQNPTGCVRENCTYLHSTKEEQNLFLATGQLPRVLAERHSNMSAAAAETIPQIALFIQESLIAPPPPPPLPPATVSAPPPPAPGSFVNPRPALLPLQKMPPPPPPPTMPSAPVMVPQPLYTAPPPQNNATSSTSSMSMVKSLPSSFPRFDASVPPPPLPKKNVANERKGQDQDAQPRKIRKTEEAYPDAYCEKCVQRDIRLEEYRQQTEKLQREDEYQSLIYRRKLEEFQRRKEELRSHVSPELFNSIVDYVEHLPVSHPYLPDGYASVSQSYNSERTTTVPRQIIIQLMDLLLNGGDRHIMESSSPASASRDESLLQTLLAQRRSSQHTDVLHLLMDTFLRQSNTTDRAQSSDFNSDILKSIANNSNENGFHRFSNGQKVESPARVAQTPAQPQGHHTYPPPAIPAPPLPAVPAPPQQPAAPAPARLYYPSPYPAPSIGVIAASTSQMQSIARVPPPPATVPPPAPLPVPLPSCQPYQIGRYPPPFYQRHQ